MYLVPIHVPIYVDGDRCLLSTEWYRSLLLLRDSLGGRFGGLTVLAPRLPAPKTGAMEQLLVHGDREDGLRLVPSFPLEGRARDFWLTHRPRWIEDLRTHVTNARVVHAGLDDLYRPISFAGFQTAVAMSKPTVFVQDVDIARRGLQLALSWKSKVTSWAYGRLFERLCRKAVGDADLSLLKGRSLMERYASHAKRARCFHDTSYSVNSVVSEERLEARLAQRGAEQSLRLVFAGRFIPEKGLDHSLEIVRKARAQGADVRLDLIGDGPERGRLGDLVEKLGLTSQVRFLGSRKYGPELLSELAAGYDGLMFTPLAEETPRMIFDGYAAGLPLFAYGVEYCSERSDEEQATVLFPNLDRDGAARVLAEFCGRMSTELPLLSRKAREAGLLHASETWYRRRAEWTIEAVHLHEERRRLAS